MKKFFNNKKNISVSLSTLPSYNYIKSIDLEKMEKIDQMENFKLKMKMKNLKNKLYLIRKKNELEEPEKINKDYQNLIQRGVYIKNSFLVKKAIIKEKIQNLDKIKNDKKEKIRKIDKEINKLILEINILINEKNIQSVNLSKMWSFSFF